MKDNQKAIIILFGTCEFFGREVSEVMSNSRKRELVEPRHFAMYYIKKYTLLSLAQIGEIVGGRDHASVIHGIRTVEDLISSNGYKSISEKLNHRLKIQVNGTLKVMREKRVMYHIRVIFRKARKYTELFHAASIAAR